MTEPDPSGFRNIGKPLPRKEDHRLLTGRGRFTDDESLPGQARAVMVRSPHPHARIRGIDTAAAMAIPGVLAAFTGADCRAEGFGPIPHSPVPSTRYDLKLTAPGGGEVFIGPHALLPDDKVRHVGEAVAMVVAETEAQALDGAEAVAVDYEVLPWVAEAPEALAPGAPALWEAVPDNVLVDNTFGDGNATTAAFAAADCVVEGEYRIGRVTGVPVEPRAALANVDPATGALTLWAGSGGPVRHKAELCAILGIEPDKLRVIAGDVGGNFGTRNRVFVEFGLVLWAARRLQRPVKYTATRSEAFLSDYQGRDLTTRVRLALNKEGKFLAYAADNISNVGARCVSLSPLGKGSVLVTGPYAIPAATVRARAVFTNTMPTQAYRSSGRPEVTYALERLIDKAAERLGMDGIDLRRRNLVADDAMPYTNPIGAPYDSGTYVANMDRSLALADWDGFPARQKAAAARGLLLGRSLANYVESSVGAARERCEITVKPEGTMDVIVGTGPSGQGHETSFAQVMADILQTDMDRIRIVQGDTKVVSVGGGSHSGRSMRQAAIVMGLAGSELISRARALAAHLFDAAPDAVSYRDGRLAVDGSNHAPDLFELAAAASDRDLPDDLQGGLSVGVTNDHHAPVFPNGCAVCEVAVDPETGHVALTRYTAVDDVGRCINPMIVHGQTHGALVQGVGQALGELFSIDPDSGQPLCGSFMDYAIPRADDLPSFTTEIVEVISPTNPFGIKAGGEGGTTPALAVVIGAIADALKPLGVGDLPLPATPFAVWSAIQAARKPA